MPTFPVPDRANSGVAVVIPCRNMAQFVGRAVETALLQSPPPTEIVIIDDGSTDDLRAALLRFGDRVRVLPGPALGSAVARNIGILASRSEFIAFLDADDQWKAGHLHEALSRFDDPEVGFTCANWQRETQDGLGSPVFETDYSVVTDGEAFAPLLRENWILTSTVVVRRAALAQSGLFDPALRGGQDFELWLRLARRTRLAVVRRCLAVKTTHGDNISSSSKYPYYMVKVWSTLRARHADAPRDEASYIQRRYAEVLYEAGRHAIRQQDVGLARYHLWAAVRQRPGDAVAWTWAALASLPKSLVAFLLKTKRSFAGG